jgi:RES domain-containing protein
VGGQPRGCTGRLAPPVSPADVVRPLERIGASIEDVYGALDRLKGTNGCLLAGGSSLSFVVEEAWARATYVKGYYDGRLKGRSSLPGVEEHWSECFDERHEHDYSFPDLVALPSERERHLKACTVDTEYVSFYRVHSKQHFRWGKDFPRNWEDNKRKLQAQERFSPAGVTGHYLGLTPDAALDEALYYGKGSIDQHSRFFLMIRCYFENILYLSHPSALDAVWTILGLDSKSLGEMYLSIMCPETDSETTNRIGLWARDSGFDGLVFPSARYGQRLDLDGLREEGKTPFPAMNSVSVGCHLDRHLIHAATLADQLVYEEAKSSPGTPFPIYAEPNLVLFSSRQLQGDDRAVFYVGTSLADREYAIRTDERPQKKNFEHWILE